MTLSEIREYENQPVYIVIPDENVYALGILKIHEKWHTKGEYEMYLIPCGTTEIMRFRYEKMDREHIKRVKLEG